MHTRRVAIPCTKLLVLAGLIAASLVLVADVTSASSPVPGAPEACDPMWSIVTTPNSGSGSNQLGALAVVSPTNIWAVGNSISGSTRKFLRMHWNGSSWTIVNGPNGQGPQNFMTGVSAVSGPDVWAVGFTSNNYGDRAGTIAQHWNGSSWATFPTPNAPGFMASRLYGVAAVSTNDVWAVGDAQTYSTGKTLIEHWNGSTWSIVPSPSPGTYGRLNSVTAVSANDVWAAGNYSNNGLQVNLILHWNGSTWTQVPAPNAGPYLQMLNSISATSANDIWACGWQLTTGGEPHYGNFILHWNGTDWQVVGTPDPNGVNTDFLYSVSGTSASDAWAAGFYDTGTAYLTFIVHWDGANWVSVPSPNPQPSDNELYAVKAISATDAWAVGAYSNGFAFRTLALHWTPPCLAPLATGASASTPQVASLALAGAAPNPFARETAIRYALPHAGVTQLTILDARGALVATLARGWRPAGEYVATWDGRTAHTRGALAAPGVYYARLTADGAVQTLRIVRLAR
jgi:hypothetical protein